MSPPTSSAAARRSGDAEEERRSRNDISYATNNGRSTGVAYPRRNDYQPCIQPTNATAMDTGFRETNKISCNFKDILKK